jgi:NAD(P)-dependent dehydrogenase (short-subunit alcohol dehydrogenase family)
MIINGKTILVTGANRGIGQALVAEALSRGAERAMERENAAFVAAEPTAA